MEDFEEVDEMEYLDMVNKNEIKKMKKIYF